MKRALKDSILKGLTLLLVFVVSACHSDKVSHADGAEKPKYTCPMHPQIIKEAPGDCPICGMELVQVRSAANTAASDTLALLSKPTDEIVVGNIKTVKPQSGTRFSGITARGVINYNTNNSASIASRVSGRIERLYVKYNYQPVSKGQKLMDIYSPDLANAQQELLFLKRNGETMLLQQAKTKLRLLGASDAQINQVLRTGKIDYTFSVYSPYSGYVSEPQVTASNSAASAPASSTVSNEVGSDGMGEMGANASSGPIPIPQAGSNSPVLVREGQYVTAGQKIFNLINTSRVWVEFYVPSSQLSEFKRGVNLMVESGADASQKSNVILSLLQPYYKQGTNFSLARAVLSNPKGQWKVGQLVNVHSQDSKKQGIWLPREAVLQTGTRFVVFVKSNGAYKPVYVNVSDKAGDWINIGNSLNTSTEVAANAWFLVDTESFIKVDSLKR